MGTSSDSFSKPAGDIIAQLDAHFGSDKWRTARADRVGEFIHRTTSGRDKAADLSNGIAWVEGGETIAGGATANPIWAAMYPEFVSGADIVFPANVDGMFLRNTGGNATTQGAYQADEFKSHTHNFRGWRWGGSGGSNRVMDAFTGSDPTKASVATGGAETRPKNRAYQLMTILDAYAE
ncbi:hypothetical protein [uncultured Pelagimonas sp.]|uniref:hypothetical protein n=1 Tax=uncultured Pelagimonas sp. TaxID=1618102 RepID=UPI0026158FD1|nr:hypothetical protein [uncultured Pelagimonas sp.]